MYVGKKKKTDDPKRYRIHKYRLDCYGVVYFIGKFICKYRNINEGLCAEFLCVFFLQLSARLAMVTLTNIVGVCVYGCEELESRGARKYLSKKYNNILSGCIYICVCVCAGYLKYCESTNLANFSQKKKKKKKNVYTSWSI